MNDSVIREILKNYESKLDQKKREQTIRVREIYNLIPRIEEIDKKIASLGVATSKEILKNSGCIENKIEQLQHQIQSLKQEKAILMTENNIPINYTDIAYDCVRCKDTGYLENGKKCNCFKQALIRTAYKMSNLERMLAKENFQTFNINLFSDESYENEQRTPKENMKFIANVCEGFVINFDKDNEENLLFYGTTGLGKTFMCNCIAKNLLDKGKIVLYQTAFNILDIIRTYKFKDIAKDTSYQLAYNLLFSSDLLIIDDLGTELTTAFTNTEMFNIINSRLVNGKKTIISTNHHPRELSQMYSDRFFSRIFGKFIELKFYGNDLRWEE
ncbi:ATP-binding protein [Clostridiaceae bacterium M8S5]|nr:ATP-binding protein [Clostridiaceae bacterium M8S5]